MQERRLLNNSQLRMKTGDKGLEGYAAVFDQWSEDLGGFRESIKPGAFKRNLGGAADVKCLFNHNESILLGRTKSGTLRISEDSTGLHFDCDLPNTQAANDLRELIRRGDISQCSFGFIPIKDSWSDNGTRRQLQDVQLFDVSPVTTPAYPQTSVSARSSGPYTLGAVRSVADPEAENAQMRARVQLATDDESETDRARARVRLIRFNLK